MALLGSSFLPFGRNKKSRNSQPNMGFTIPAFSGIFQKIKKYQISAHRQILCLSAILGT